LDAGQLVVFDDEPFDRTVDDPDAAGCEFGGLTRRWFLGVGEVDDVVGPLAHDLRVLDRARAGADDAEGLVADFVAVAIGAVEQVTAPPLRHAGDVGDAVDDAGGDEDPPSCQRPPVPEMDGEAGVDPDDHVIDEVDAVALDLRSPDGEELRRREAVARQVPLHVRGGGVAW